MKIKALISAVIILLASIHLNAQIFKNNNLDYKSLGIKCGFMFLSGAIEGHVETTTWHPQKFQAVFPKADMQYWDPNKSWTNKYKNGDPDKGEKWPLSSTWGVWTTDGYHLFRTSQRLLVYSALTIDTRKHCNKPKKFGDKVVEALIIGAAWTAGNALTYHVIYRN